MFLCYNEFKSSIKENQLRTETLAKEIWAAALLLFVAAGSLAFVLLGKRWAPGEEPSWVAQRLEKLRKVETASPSRMSDYGVIWKRMAAPEDVSPPRAEKSAPVPAPIAHEVIATFLESQASSCYAVVRDPAGKQYLVTPGDAIDDLVVLRITAEGVTVKQGGREVLFKVAAQNDKRASAARLSPQLFSTRRKRSSESLTPSSASPSRAEPEGKPARDIPNPFVVTKEQASYYVQNMGTLLARVGLAAHHDEDGNVDGLQIKKMPADAPVQWRGLSEGDIVKRINETALTDARQLPQIAYQILKDDPPYIAVVIEREGKQLNYIYELR
jgi:type II secretory pathway component PulC